MATKKKELPKLAEKKENIGNPLEIPFGKPARVLNYRLWRSKYVMKRGKEKMDVECIHVSDLSGIWMVRVPATSPMFALITQGYAISDDTMRENFLGMVLTNFLNITTTGSEALHDALFFLTEMMSFPYLLLSEKEMKERMKANIKRADMDPKKWKHDVEKMVEYRKKLYELAGEKRDRLIAEYERQLAERNGAEDEANEQLEMDVRAEEAAKILAE